MASIPKAIESFKSAKTLNPNEHVELELRFVIASIGEFKNMMQNIGGESVGITMETDLIKTIVDTNCRATMRFKDSGSSIVRDGKFEYGAKEKLHLFYVTDNFITYKIAISIEKNIPQFDISTINLIRIKLRNSIIVAKFPQWRFDFTASIELQNIRDAQERRQKLFITGITHENFLTKVPFIEADKFEFEIEYIGKDLPTVANIIELIQFLKESCQHNVGIDVELQKYIFEIASLIYPPDRAEKCRAQCSVKTIGNSPISLDTSTYFKHVLPNIQNYALSEKADGLHCLGIISGENIFVVGATLNRFSRKVDSNDTTKSIFEAELIDTVLYVYDVIMFKNESIDMKPFKDRMKYIDKIAKLLGEHGKPKNHIILTENYAAQIEERYRGTTYPYEIDGLIFTNIENKYIKNEIYKWKEILTFDFLVVKALPEHIGVPPYTPKQGYDLYFLFCGISKTDHETRFRIKRIPGYNKLFYGQKFYTYYPIQFSPSSNSLAYIYYHKSSEDLNGKICEFKLVKREWQFIKERSDKNVDAKRGNNFGNDIKTIMSMYSPDILTYDMLKKPIASYTTNKEKYFGKTDSRYVPANMFAKFVKGRALESIAGMKDAIDLSAGRGADLQIFNKIGIKNLVVVDIDSDALKHLQQKHIKLGSRDNTYKINLEAAYTMDLLNNWEENNKMIGRTFPLAVCNMAIHYFCESDKTIMNFALLVDSILDAGGIFTFTCMNGRRIFNKLAHNAKYDLVENGIVKYSIERMYDEKTFENYGQHINILLGFADGQMRSEPLANIEYIVSIFAGLGFTLVCQKSFDTFFTEYSIEEIDIYDKMSDNDFEHEAQYDYVILKKSIIVKK